jgi:hypothetical protein
MAGYNIQGDLLSQGVNCVVRVDPNSDTGEGAQVIGFVSEASIRKSINVQRAEVIGEILPVSLDPTGIQVTVSLKGFVPAKGLLDKGISTATRGGGNEAGGNIQLKSFNPNDDDFIEKRVATKIPYLEIYDEKHKCSIGYTTWLMATSYGDSISGKGYVQADCTLEGIGYWSGNDYPNTL